MSWLVGAIEGVALWMGWSHLAAGVAGMLVRPGILASPSSIKYSSSLPPQAPHEGVQHGAPGSFAVEAAQGAQWCGRDPGHRAADAVSAGSAPTASSTGEVDRST